ncbi:hypothetical protein H8B02_35650 [Bradyrhizobium sp. Pear77]|uniref:hypothetical protein n=1 Tax=Bradyrhizobium TaxID=374 RepID=UPI001E2D776E|nr:MULTISPECIES: hypothetical protein [Bradyrhizobium]MCC8958568.1 hypothetical protein [Bradyrhizobium altum]MCC8967070.1 hypothetical protein [Bradyrhizobium oropedii]
MNTDRAQLDADGSFEISDSEASQSEASEAGSPVAAQWNEALTDARPSTADAVWSQDRALEDWAAEEGQGDDENRQTAVNQTSAWLEDGNFNEALDLSSLSLSALPAARPPELRALDVMDNQLTGLPELPPGSGSSTYRAIN